MKHRISGLTLGLALAPLFLGACASNTWQGAQQEAIYDKTLEAVRATQVLNNDDYYEIHKDNRIYVISDVKDLKNFTDTGELPFRVTRIGGGPKGETIVFGIAAPESKKKDGFGSVEMYDGRRQGAEKDFYAEVVNNNNFYVFGTWAALDSFRKSGSTSGLSSAGSIGPGGEAVMVAQPSDALLARFKTLHGTQ